MMVGVGSESKTRSQSRMISTIEKVSMLISFISMKVSSIQMLISFAIWDRETRVGIRDEVRILRDVPGWHQLPVSMIAALRDGIQVAPVKDGAISAAELTSGFGKRCHLAKDAMVDVAHPRASRIMHTAVAHRRKAVFRDVPRDGLPGSLRIRVVYWVPVPTHPAIVSHASPHRKFYPKRRRDFSGVRDAGWEKSIQGCFGIRFRAFRVQVLEPSGFVIPEIFRSPGGRGDLEESIGVEIEVSFLGGDGCGGEENVRGGWSTVKSAGCCPGPEP